MVKTHSCTYISFIFFYHEWQENDEKQHVYRRTRPLSFYFSNKYTNCSCLKVVNLLYYLLPHRFPNPLSARFQPGQTGRTVRIRAGVDVVVVLW